MAGSAEENVVLVERDGDIVTVVLNRPEKLNALNKAMWRRLGDVMAELDGDTDVRCIVLRGAGDKALGPGADPRDSMFCPCSKSIHLRAIFHSRRLPLQPVRENVPSR